MTQIQSSLIKKNKDWTSRTLANLHPLRPITYHFCFTPSPHPPQSGRHMCITPNDVRVDTALNRFVGK